jgi:glycerate dehydrogenase
MLGSAASDGASMHKIVFLDAATLAEGVTLPRPDFPHQWTNYPATAPDEFAARAAEAEFVVTNKVRVGAAEIAALPGLRLIAIAATGYDHVDVDAARAAGIAVTNIRAYSVDSVPEHTFALILALQRQILPYVADVRAGQWQACGQFAFHTHKIHDLRGKRLGLFGSGGLGQKVAALAAAFGMETVFAGRKGEKARPGTMDFDEVLATSDILSLHCPLNAATENMIGWAEFSALRRKPLLINTARGGLVDEEALERALDAGLVAGAGLDVTRPEPPPADSAIMRLARRPNVLVTPHVAWASLESQQTLADQLGAVLAAFVKGERMNRLD